MIGIATYFGITYDELSLANPEVNPNFLSIGTQLIIPLPEGETDGEDGADQTSPELLPLEVGVVSCYLLPTGGMWCYLPVVNALELPAENISGIIRLYDTAGEEIASQPAYGHLNLLLPGAEMPLSAYFSPPVDEWSSAQGQLVGASAANQVDTRYQIGELQIFNSQPLDEDRLGFQVSGTLIFPPSAGEEGTDPVTEYVWVLAVAYDADGSVVGVRRWEARLEEMGDEVDFQFEVFSLGKPIDTVQVLPESRISLP